MRKREREEEESTSVLGTRERTFYGLSHLFIFHGPMR